MKSFFGHILLPIFLLITCGAIAQDNVEYGIASYYSDDFHGRRTAYGEIYDKNDLTAAHKRHPHGTILKITRLDNKKSVRVRVNDKGPYIKGRVVDVSKKAALTLGLVNDGVAEVKVEVVEKGTSASKGNGSESITQIPDERPSEYNERSVPEKKTTTTKPKEKTTTKTSSSSSTKTSSKPSTTKKTTRTSSKPKTTTKTRSVPKEYSQVVREEFSTYGLYKIVLEKPFKRGFGVQVASLTNYENALKQIAQLQANWFNNVLMSIEPGFDGPIYKIIMGPFETEAEAANYKNSLQKKHKMSGFVIDLESLNN